MNWRAIRAIVRKDLSVVARTRGVLLPLIIVPIIMLVLLPGLAALAPTLGGITEKSLQDLDQLAASMPPALQAELGRYTAAQRWIVLAVVYLLAPMYLIVPLMVSSVIGADSFAGEKERKTLEALLYTPTSDAELFLAKLLSAWLPAMGVAIGGFVLYGLVANLAAWPVMGRVFFPNATWLALVLWVAPAVAGLGLVTMVLISVRVQGFQEAYQLGGAVVLPVVVLVVGQATGVMYFSLGLVLLLGLFVWVVDAVLLWLGAHTFQRSNLIARL